VENKLLALESNRHNHKINNTMWLINNRLKNRKVSLWQNKWTKQQGESSVKSSDRSPITGNKNYEIAASRYCEMLVKLHQMW